ncbi:alpha/beta fold hydrolase [Halomonas sp. SH5A2]|uniref:alpha/beta hydrolase n=1 Tax=Halomonas sp. SH5A2 TaxID=2749040 RepID=UPI00164047E6|nr:alpha/beta fold hydrolase [Halomonas sp. SH5A2]QNI03298.1 alpha/beta fold hydrolase [Halomonas sp. SH5A2]
MMIAVMGMLVAMSTSANASGLDVEALASAQESRPLPALQTFEARDETALAYRHYPSDSLTVLILVHGSGTDSRYLATLAHELAEAGAASVYTPDVRGHGPSPVRRGDIDYIEQLEDDLVDLITHIKDTNADVTKVVVGGHSSGGGLAVRFAGGQHGHLASAYLLLAPYLGHDAPTVRDNSGGWAKPSVAKILSISMLNAIGITHFNGADVLHFNLPPEYRDGLETLAYSYRLMTGFSPADFRQALGSVQAPVLVATGAEDEAFYADQFEPVLRPLVPHADITTVEGASHLGLVVSEEGIATVRRWLQGL